MPYKYMGGTQKMQKLPSFAKQGKDNLYWLIIKDIYSDKKYTTWKNIG